MNNYYEQLSQIKKDMRAPRKNWTPELVSKLLRDGTDGVHSDQECRAMLSNLRNKPNYRNRYTAEIHEYEQSTGKKFEVERLRKHWTEHEDDLVRRHIVPIGRNAHECSTRRCMLGIKGEPIQPWRYESKRDNEMIEKKIVDTPKPVIPVQKPNCAECNLLMNLKAVKTLFQSGMTTAAISKFMGKEENHVVAMLKVAEEYV